MFKGLLDPDFVAELGDIFGPDGGGNPPEAGGGHTVVDRGAYTVITVNDPKSLYLRKDAPGGGIDYYKGDEVVVNGPLFKAPQDGVEGTPVGGFFQDGAWQQPLVDPKTGKGNFADTNGVIGQKKDGSYFLMSYDQFTHKSFSDSDISWAFQNGPMLLQNGQNLNSASTPQRDMPRTAIGFNANGDLVIVDTKGPSNMYLTGTYLKNEGVDNAIFLDGTNVGYIEKGQERGNIVDGSTTLHITTQKELSRGR